MELMQLEMFMAVAEERSVQKAARRVYRTQPAVSISLAKLERECGMPLMVRSPQRGCHLTAAGETLYAYSARILGLRNEAVTVLAANLAGAVAGREMA